MFKIQLAALVVFLSAAFSFAESMPRASTTSGIFEGKFAGSSAVYLGIPFAEPPVKDLRFRAPVSMHQLPGVQPAYQYKSDCSQPSNPAKAYSGIRGSEDCLYLNVFVPPQARLKKVPVMVFFPGGAFISGGSSENYQSVPGTNLTLKNPFYLYEASNLAAASEKIIVVSNYRLGVLGFLAHPALLNETGGRAGNYGMLDQIEALRWVQKNISQFGGDASNVTIFGESAGAQSVCALLASPLGRGLFHRAIMESGHCASRSLALATEMGTDLINGITGNLDCSQSGNQVCCRAPESAQCLRSLSDKNLIGPTHAMLTFDPQARIYSPGSRFFMEEQFIPVVDGYFLNNSSLGSVQSGAFNRVPLLIGSNDDELGMGTKLQVANWSELQSFLESDFGQVNGKRIYNLYRRDLTRSLADVTEDIRNNTQFTCWQRLVARAVSRHLPGSVFLYHFRRRPAFVLPSFHGSELFYVFQNVNVLYQSLADAVNLSIRQAPWSEQQTQKEVLARWSSFSSYGKPGNQMPAYEPDSSEYQILDAIPSNGRKFYQAECDAFDQYILPVIESP